MTNFIAKTVSVLIFASVAMTATANAESANHMTADAFDVNGYVMSLNELTAMTIEASVMQAAEAIVAAEIVTLSEMTMEPPVQFAAVATETSGVQMTYGNVPAFFLVPVAD